MNSTPSGASGGTDEVRVQVRLLRRRQLITWVASIFGVVLLYYFFSAGFFLYSVVTVLMLLTISTAMAKINVVGMQVDRSVARVSLSPTEETEVVLTLRNLKNLPALWIRWHEQLTPGIQGEGALVGTKTLGARQVLKLKYRLRAEHRGLFRIGPVRIEGSDPFGLVRRFVLDNSAVFVTVTPKVVPINPDWPLGHRPALKSPTRRGLFDDPSRFIGVREYRAGDSLRRIHWRASARCGGLQTRLFQPSVLQGCLVAVDAHSDHAAKLELSVCAAASVSDYVLNARQSVGLLSNGADAAELFPVDWQERAMRQPKASVSLPAGRGAWQRRQVMDVLARLITEGHFELGEVLLAAAPHLSRSLLILVVTPVIDHGLATAIHSLKHSGFDLVLIWTRGSGDTVGADPLHLLPEIPVYPVSDEQDLQWLGTHSL